MDGAALSGGGAVKEDGGFFHSEVSILLSGQFMMTQASSGGWNKVRGRPEQTHANAHRYRCDARLRLECVNGKDFNWFPRAAYYLSTGSSRLLHSLWLSNWIFSGECAPAMAFNKEVLLLFVCNLICVISASHS